MSVISIHAEDTSNFLCKRFAALATAYFEAPNDARKPTAQVPLENLFRLLEMYRNKTFSDETHGGVLALESLGSGASSADEGAAWQTDIEQALHHSFATAFDGGLPEQEAAVELQSSLRWLVTGRELPNQAAAIGRAKLFFAELSHSL